MTSVLGQVKVLVLSWGPWQIIPPSQVDLDLETLAEALGQYPVVLPTQDPACLQDS